MFAILLLALLFHQAFSNDPCPLHGSSESHPTGSSLYSSGMLCLCMIVSYCPHPMADFALIFPDQRVVKNPLPDQVMRLWVQEIFHPPRSARLG